MRKGLSLAAPLLIVLMLLAGCESHPTGHDLAICGSYGVPGMFCSELKGGTYRCEVLETDAQGRVLFAYTTHNEITGKEETALVICQAVDSSHVYFYEDQCYLPEDTADTADVDLLKKQNDWGSALDYGKMSKRQNKVSFDLFVITPTDMDYRKVTAACCDELDISESQIKELIVLDENPGGQAIYWLISEQDGTTGKYYVLVNERYETAYLCADDGPASAADIMSFKQENGWKYGS